MAYEMIPVGDAVMSYNLLRSVELFFSPTGGQNDLASIAKAGFVLGIIITCVRWLFTQKLDLHVLLIIMILYTAFVKSNVPVEIRSNTTGYPLVGIVNLPIGIALPTTLYSRLSGKLIQLSDTAFSTNSPFSDSGKPLENLRIMLKMRELITHGKFQSDLVEDGLLIPNLTTYINECRMEELMGRPDAAVHIKAMLSSPNLWDELDTGWWMKLAAYTTDSAIEIIDCPTFYDRLDTIIGSDLNTSFGTRLFNDVADGIYDTFDSSSPALVATNRAIVEQAIRRTGAEIMASSKNHLAFMQTLLLQSAMVDATQLKSEQIGDTAMQYQIVAAKQSLLDQTSQQSYIHGSLIWRYATILEVLVIAALPFSIFLMMLGSFGISIIFGFVVALAYLAFWNPMAHLVEGMFGVVFDSVISSRYTDGLGNFNIGSPIATTKLYAEYTDWFIIGNNLMLMVPALAGLVLFGVGKGIQGIASNFNTGSTVSTANTSPVNGSVNYGADASTVKQGYGIVDSTAVAGSTDSYKYSVSSGLDATREQEMEALVAQDKSYRSDAARAYSATRSIVGQTMSEIASGTSYNDSQKLVSRKQWDAYKNTFEKYNKNEQKATDIHTKTEMGYSMNFGALAQAAVLSGSARATRLSNLDGKDVNRMFSQEANFVSSKEMKDYASRIAPDGDPFAFSAETQKFATDNSEAFRNGDIYNPSTGESINKSEFDKLSNKDKSSVMMQRKIDTSDAAPEFMKGKNGFSVSATLAEHLGEKNALTKEEQNKVLKEINAKADSNEGMKALKDAQAKKTSKLGVMLGGLAVGLSGFNGGIRFDASDKNAVSQAKELAIDFGDRFSASGTSDSSKDLSVLFNQNETGSESEVDSKASEARQSISRSNAFTESNREKLELANKYSRSVKQSGEISRADLEGFAQNNPQKADQWLSEVTGGQVPNFRTSKQRSKRVANELSKLFNDPTSDNLNKAANLFSLMGEDRLESITRQNAEYDLDWSFTQPDVQKPQNNATKEIPLSTVDKPSKANGVEAEADRRAKNGQTKPSQVDPDEAINRFNDDVERGYFAHSTSDQLNNASAAASPVLKQGPNNLEQVDQQRLKSPLNKGVFDFGRDFLTLANSSIKALAMASNGISKTQAYIGSSLVAFADAYDNHLSGFGTSPDADSRRAEYQDKYGSIVDEIKSSAYYEMSKSIDDGTYNDFISDNQNATQVASELFDIRNNPIVENADTAAYELSRNPTFKSHFESASSKQSDLFDKIQGMDLNAYDVGASLVKTVGENAGEMAGDMLNGVFDIDGVNMSKQSENQLIEAANQFNNGTLYDAIGQKIETNEDQRKYVLDVLQNNDDTGYSTAIDEQFFNTDWLGGKGALEKIYDSQTNPGARRKGRR